MITSRTVLVSVVVMAGVFGPAIRQADAQLVGEITGYPGSFQLGVPGQMIYIDLCITNEGSQASGAYYLGLMDYTGVTALCPAPLCASPMGGFEITKIYAPGEVSCGTVSWHFPETGSHFSYTGTKRLSVFLLDREAERTTWSEVFTIEVVDGPLPQEGPDLCDAGEPYDLDGNPLGTFDPTTINAGEEITIRGSIRNAGTEPAGSFQITFYASLDTVINPNVDHQIGHTGTFNVELQPGQWRPFHAPRNVNIPPGQYYVGWIIDSTNWVAETDETNNIVVITSPRLTVLGPPIVAPTVSTEPATSITRNSATLNGRIDNDGGEACQYRFRYRQAGTSTWTETTWTGSMRSGQSFSQAVTGLSPATTYQFIAEARNSAGTHAGTQLTFTTAPPLVEAPTVSTQNATNITHDSATLNGRVTNDGGEVCQYRFRYRRAGTSTWTETTWTGSIRSGQSFSRAVTGLSAGTTYEFVAQARNSAGTGSGAQLTFATAPPPVVAPTVSTEPATSITHNSATLNGRITDDGGAVCQYRFRYRVSGGAYVYTSWTGSVRSGGSLSEALSGLAAATTYYFVVQGRNSAGESAFGTELNFTTEPLVEAPIVSTQNATSITHDSATLHGRIENDGGAPCERRFVYRVLNTPSWTETDWSNGLSTGVSFSRTLQNVLMPNTTYEFRAEAKNSAGMHAGTRLTFTTAPPPVVVPTVSTEPATSITHNSATLNGRVTNDGGEACQYQFRYRRAGTSTWTETPWTGSIRSGQSFSRAITGLSAGTTYEFVAQAKNSAGGSSGNEETFDTRSDPSLEVRLTDPNGAAMPPTVMTLPACPVESDSATLHGKILESGDEACQWRFRYIDADSFATFPPPFVYTEWSDQERNSGESFQQDLKDLLPMKTYVFQAQARNSAGESEWGPGLHFKASYPTITQIRGKHFMASGPTLSGWHAHFLQGISLNETVEVHVDWAGAEPNEVQWYINGRLSHRNDCRGKGDGLAAVRTFNMGTQFGVNDKLSVVATATQGTRDVSSTTTIAPFSIIPAPPIDPGIRFSPHSRGQSLRYVSEPVVVKNLLDANLSDWGHSIPDSVPIFGGGDLGFGLSNRAQTIVEGRSAVEQGPSVDTNVLSLAGISVELGSRYSISSVYYPQQGWVLNGGSLTTTCKAKIPIYHQEVRIWKVGGAVTVGLQLNLENTLGVQLDLENTWAQPVWVGYLVIAPGAYVHGVVDLIVVSAKATATGGLRFGLDYTPGGSVQLGELCVDTSLKVKGCIKVWRWKKCRTWQGNWDVWCPVKRSGKSAHSLLMVPSDPLDMAILISDDGGWNLISRDYRDADYAVWLPATPRDKHGGQKRLHMFSPPDDPEPAIGCEQVLQTNIFEFSDPSLAVVNGDLLLVWVYDDPSRSNVNGTQVVFSRSLGETWTLPVPIDDDGTADFSPQLAGFPTGQVLCVWENVNRPLREDAELEDVAAAMEITAALYDDATGQWTTTALTSNSYLDHSPRVAAAPNNTALVAWVSNDGDDILGEDPDAVNTIRYSLWADGIWSEPGIAATGIIGLTGAGANPSTALGYDGTRAVYMYPVDTDGNPETNEDVELYALVYDGSQWAPPIRLTHDDVPDLDPQIVYDQGEPLLVWYRDGSIVSCRGLDTTDIRQIVEADRAEAQFRLARSPEGRLSLVWTAFSQEVMGYDIFTATYDPEFDLWSQPYRLTSDTDVERALAAVHVVPDELALVYNKDRIDTNADGDQEAYQTDLCVLRRQLGRDLAVFAEDISISEANPAPGSTVEITAVVHNLGDVTEIHVPVGFYYGDPGEDGVLIGDQIIEGPILAGGMGTASVSWTIPLTDDPKEVTVVVFDTEDPQTGRPERDWNNNIAWIAVMRPDLNVRSFYWEQTGYNELKVTVVVANAGVVSARNVEVAVRRDAPDGAVLEHLVIPGIAASSTGEASVNWDIVGLDFVNPDVLLYAVINEDRAETEADGGNTGFCLVDLSEMLDIVAEDLVPISVPNVVGMTQAQASATIIAAGLSVGTVSTSQSTTMPQGQVISQSPVAGMQVALGSAVNLVISRLVGPDGLVAHWKLDESVGMIAHDAEGNHHGLLRGNPLWMPDSGVLGGALWFSGAGDYVEIADHRDFDLTTRMTVSAWVKVDAFDKDWQAIVTKGDSAWRLHRAEMDNALAFHFTRPAGGHVSADGVRHVNDGEWHHVVGTYDGTMARLYIDGQLDGSAAIIGSISTNRTPVMIGENGEARGRYWSGVIDDVRIYDQALSQREIRTALTALD